MEASGRLVRFVSIYFRTYKSARSRVMSKKTKVLTTKGREGRTLRRSIVVPGGLITSTGVVLEVLVLVFVIRGGFFTLS